MSHSGTLRELSRAINGFLPSPNLPLPDELQEIIEAYLHKHEAYDDGASTRLQDEMQSIYNKQIKDAPDRLPPFAAIMLQLFLVLRTEARISQWWDVLVGRIMNHDDYEKALAPLGPSGLVKILASSRLETNDSGSDAGPNPFAARLISVWMDTYGSLISGNGGNVADVKERRLIDTIFAFGKRKPKPFLISLDKFFVKKEYRLRSIWMLREFIQAQPPHLHEIMQTPLFGDLMRCLQHDTSTTVVSLALTALNMLLPHMPSSLAPHLPTLFNVYARLLFWAQERAGDIEALAEDPKSAVSASGWEACEFMSEIDDVALPHLMSYFTILYGLYPINFMDYIRKPQRYLRHAKSPNAEEIEVQPTEIRDKSERFRQGHGLHPNFYTLTIESEKTDHGRWIRSEPAEVTAECMALCLISQPDSGIRGPASLQAALQDITSPVAGDVEKDRERDGREPSLLNGSGQNDSWRNSGSPASSRVQSTMPRQNSQSSHPSNLDSTETRNREVPGDSPTLPAHLVSSPSHTQLQEMLNSNKVIKSGIHQSLANDSVPSLALSYTDSSLEKSSNQPRVSIQHENSPVAVSDLAGQVAQLQRQVLLLQNDLGFERYLKQQHMVHIGELRRRQVGEQATEAATQRLLLERRDLKNRLEEAKKAEMQIRKESEKGRTLAKKWESDLAAKLKTLREESRKTKVDGDALRRELQGARDERDALRKMLCDAEVKELNSKQAMRSIEIHTEEVHRLKAEVARLTAAERDSQARDAERQAAARAVAEAQHTAELLRMQLDARGAELQRAKTLFQGQIATLSSKLAAAQHGAAPKKSAADAAALREGALAASRSRQEEMQQQYDVLLKRYTALQASTADQRRAQAATSAPAASSSLAAGYRVEPFLFSDSDAEGSPLSLTPVTSRTRPHRVFSDPEMFETGSFGSGSGEGRVAAGPRPGTPPGTGAAPAPGGSPERIHGRGGVQNRIRKEGKEKKMIGLRGIRSFTGGTS